jgi:hypothetical protein
MGNSGAWLTSAVQHLAYLRDRDLYETGDAILTAIEPASVDLSAPQPVVILQACLDGSSVTMRYRKTGKPVPVATVVGADRHLINARLVYAPSKTGAEMWFLVEEEARGEC